MSGAGHLTGSPLGRRRRRPGPIVERHAGRDGGWKKDGQCSVWPGQARHRSLTFYSSAGWYRCKQPRLPGARLGEMWGVRSCQPCRPLGIGPPVHGAETGFCLVFPRVVVNPRLSISRIGWVMRGKAASEAIGRPGSCPDSPSGSRDAIPTAERRPRLQPSRAPTNRAC